MVDQITVFLENSEGRLKALCRTLADAGISMSALTIADTADYGVVRIICDKPAEALEALTGADYRAICTKYNVTFHAPAGGDVLKIRGAAQAAEAAQAIEKAGFKLLTQEELA